MKYLLLLAFTTTHAAELHIAPGGDDTKPGTSGQPLATFAAARDLARDIENATVVVHAGTYYLPETLVLDASDNGTTFRAAEGETVVLSGGTRLELDWRPHRDGIMRAKTPAGLVIDQLFLNGRRMPMARYPNHDPAVRPYGGFSADAFSPRRAARWDHPAGGFIHAMHRAHWGGYHYRITGKKADGTVAYEGGWQNNRQMGMHPQHRFVENIFEELDAPGEWFHDAKSATLYHIPEAGTDLSSATIEAVRLRHLIEIRGTRAAPARKITLRGFVFRHAARSFMDVKEPLLRSDWTVYRGSALVFDGTEDCTLADCEIDQPGGNAIFVNNYNRRIAIRGCHIHDTGASAIAFVGDPGAVRSPLFEYNQRQEYERIDKTPGPKSDNFPADCLVEDCLIHGVGQVEKQATGVQISMAARITIRHCSIYDASRAGINISEGTFGGHLVEGCDVFDTVRETGDHGSFNSWGRDRFWGLKNVPAGKLPELARLDAVETTVLRNNRWRCDHGWDVDPAAGDFRVKDGSPALALGFENFAMDQFGVRNPELRKIARTPEIPAIKAAGAPDHATPESVRHWLGARIRELKGDEFSAFGVSRESGGIHLAEVPADSLAAAAGLQSGDLVQQVNGKPSPDIATFHKRIAAAAGKPLSLTVVRGQKPHKIEVTRLGENTAVQELEIDAVKTPAKQP